jgi:ubiquinone/menaquinone biosynthesis C-methylase UbiE
MFLVSWGRTATAGRGMPMQDKDDVFQPAGGSWSKIAELDGLRSVIDPNDVEGSKNQYITHMHKAAIRSAVTFNKKMTVLDFGCGIGRLSKYFSGFVDKVVGVDITERMIDKAREANSAGNIEYLLIDGVHTSLKNDSVDLVVSVGTLQYAVRDAAVFDRIMREFHRVLIKGGKICFLEQINKSGTLVGAVKKESYVNGMDKYFAIDKNYPVRLGGIQTLAHRAMFRKHFPKILFPWAASREMMATKKIKDQDLLRFPYVDYLFVGHVRK